MTRALSSPRAVIFDWDNTLVDSWGVILAAYNRTFRHFGMAEWSMEQAQSKVAKSMRDSFPGMFGDRWPEARDVFYQSYEDLHLIHLRALDGAEALLHALFDAGIYLAVVSNKNGGFLRTESDALGWTPLFGELIGANDAPKDKPDPAPVHMAMAKAGFGPGPDVWFVGDAGVDLQCAVNSGCQPVLLRPHPPQNGEFLSHPPVQYQPNCISFLALVRELTIPNRLI